MTINHVGIPVSNARRARAFYTLALAPLGIKATMTIEPSETHSGGTAVGMGTDEEPGFFWIGDNEAVGEGIHIAFSAENREQVHAFHHAAIEAGGTDNGEPALRPQYGANYYAAYVLDHDGHNIEVVCLAEV